MSLPSVDPIFIRAPLLVGPHYVWKIHFLCQSSCIQWWVLHHLIRLIVLLSASFCKCRRKWNTFLQVKIYYVNVRMYCVANDDFWRNYLNSIQCYQNWTFLLAMIMLLRVLVFSAIIVGDINSFKLEPLHSEFTLNPLYECWVLHKSYSIWIILFLN